VERATLEALDHDIPEYPGRLLTVRDVADLLNVKVSWVYIKVESGELPHVRLGPRYLRFHLAAITAYLRSQERGAGVR
jgi:excisionase family DNA binding protein